MNASVVSRSLLLECCELVRQSAELALSFYRSPDLAVRQKANRTPVSAADEAVGLFLRAELRRRTGWPVISEETVDEDQAEFAAQPTLLSKPVWWVDPIDGTKNFIEADDEFSIVIGLAVSGIPSLGIIFAAAKDDLFFAACGHGAWRQTRSGEATRVFCSSAAPDVLLTKFPSVVGKERALEYYATRGYGREQIKQVGSAYKSGLVAAGEFAEAVSFDHMALWDICGPEAILREAGGAVVELPHRTTFIYDPLSDPTRAGYVAYALS